MSDKPPVRLLDDPSVDTRLQHDLQAARAQPPLHYDVASGLAQLKERLPEASGQAAAGTSGGGAGASVGTGALKWWVTSALGLTAAGVLWWAASDPGASSRTQPAHRTGVEVAGPTPQAPAIEPSGAAPTVPLPEQNGTAEAPVPVDESLTQRPAAPGATEPHAPEAADEGRMEVPAFERPRGRRARPSRSAARSAPAQPAVEDPDARKLREIRQLAEARRALQGDPALALRLSRAGQREFRDGMFVQERSALIVFALDALGRTQQAHEAARAHLRHHADGPFAARVRKILEAQP